MKINPKIVFFSFLLIIPLAIASWEYNPFTDELDYYEPTNSSCSINVNKTNYWDNLDDPSDILTSELDNDEGFITSFTDTNASTACAGTTTYLDGEGNCDDISGVYLTSYTENDALWYANYTAMNSTWNTTQNSTYDALITNQPDSGSGWENETGLVSLTNQGDNISAGVLFIDNSNNQTNVTGSFRVGNSSQTFLFIDKDTGYIGINTESPDYRFHLLGGIMRFHSSTIGGYATQINGSEISGDCVGCSPGTDHLYLNPYGDYVCVGTKNPTAMFEVNGAATNGLSMNISGDLFVNDTSGHVEIIGNTLSESMGTGKYGLLQVGGETLKNTGLMLNPTIIGSLPSLYGLRMVPTYSTTENKGTVYNLISLPRFKDSNFNITNVYDIFLRSDFYNSFNGTITNLYGIRLGNFYDVDGTGAVVENIYGLDIADVEDGTVSNYAIKTGKGLVSFRDDVGIGTTSPGSNLEISSSKDALSGTDDQSNYNLLITQDPDGGLGTGPGLAFISGAASVSAAIIAEDSGSVNLADLVFYTDPGGVATEKVRITGLGNVGIGTTSPTSPAGVNKFLEISDSVHAGIVIDDSGTAGQAWDIFNSAGTIYFKRNNVHKMTLTDIGVGIGTTAPGAALEVKGGIGGIQILGITRGTTGANDNNWGFKISGKELLLCPTVVNAKLKFGTTIDAAVDMLIDADGDVGIGETNPTKALQLGASKDIWVTDGSICVENSGGTDCGGSVDGTVYADDYQTHTIANISSILNWTASEEILRHRTNPKNTLKPDYSTYSEGIKVTGYNFPDELDKRQEESNLTQEEFYNILKQDEKDLVRVGTGMSVGGLASLHDDALKEQIEINNAQQIQIAIQQNTINDLESRLIILEKLIGGNKN